MLKPLKCINKKKGNLNRWFSMEYYIGNLSCILEYDV